MTDPERTTVIIMLRDLEKSLQKAADERHGEYLAAFGRMGDAIGEVRSDVRSLSQTVEHHVAMDDLKFDGVGERCRRIESDHRQLRTRVDAVDETGKQQAIALVRNETRDDALQVHLTKESDRSHGWVRYVVGVAVLLAISLIAFFAKLAIGGL